MGCLEMGKKKHIIAQGPGVAGIGTTSSSVGIGIAIFIAIIALCIGTAGFVLGLISTNRLPFKVNQHDECSSDSDCEDSNICTIDLCQANGLCDYITVPQCNPFSIAENTLYVSPDWIPSITNSTYYFKTISAAITAAGTYTRTTINPVTIFVNQGIYSENITLIPNIIITGISTQFQSTYPSVIIEGSTFNYVDSLTGVNLAISISNLAISNNILISFASRGLSDGGFTYVTFDNCLLNGNLIYVARPLVELAPPVQDYLYLLSCSLGTTGFSVVTFTGQGMVTADDITFGGDSFNVNNTMTMLVSAAYFSVESPVSILQASSLEMYSSNSIGMSITTANAGSSFSAYNCIFSAGSFTVGSGTSFDLRTSEIAGTSTSGSGTFARSILIAQNVASAAGINTFNISPPYPSTLFNVLWSQVGGVNDQDIKLTSKTASSFQWNDTVGNNHFDFTLIMP